MAMFAHKLMLLKSNEDIIVVYILNYTLLLSWGVGTVVMEAFSGAVVVPRAFPAYSAFVVGIICATVHALCPLLRRHAETVEQERTMQENEAAVDFKVVQGYVVQMPDGASVLAIAESPTASEAPARVTAAATNATATPPVRRGQVWEALLMCVHGGGVHGGQPAATQPAARPPRGLQDLELPAMSTTQGAGPTAEPTVGRIGGASADDDVMQVRSASAPGETMNGAAAPSSGTGAGADDMGCVMVRATSDPLTA